MKLYSQYGEDALLAEIFCGSIGLCVEVGANDGFKYSNTKYFEEIGWQCILIEPTPHLCDKLRQNRKGILFECAASSTEGEMPLYIVQEHDLFSSLESCSTMADELSRHQADIKTVLVRVRTLNNIFAEALITSIDFVSIDVEGHEMEVLLGFDLNRWSPRVVIIEDKSDLYVTQVEQHMTRFGYRRFYRSGGNDWYACPGQIDVRFMLRMLLASRIRLRGIMKVWLPRSFVRFVLRTHRFFKNIV